MKKFLFFILLFGLGCASTKNAAMKPGRLNGTWVTIKMEIDNEPLPKAAFENQKLIISDSAYTFIAESVDKGIVKYKDNKMDIYGKDGVNNGKHFTAIYKYEKEQLTICYNLAGDRYPDSFETKGKPTFFLAVFKKQN